MQARGAHTEPAAWAPAGTVDPLVWGASSLLRSLQLPTSHRNSDSELATSRWPVTLALALLLLLASRGVRGAAADVGRAWEGASGGEIGGGSRNSK